MTSKNLIFGLDSQMSKVLNYCKLFLSNNTDFKEAREKLSITSTFLFHGFPGTGKTTIARKIHEELKKEFSIDLKTLKIEELLSSNFGESSKMLWGFFEDIEVELKKDDDSYAFIIIDELDYFTVNRYQNDSESIKRVLLTFNKIIDELFRNGMLNRIIIIATTNVKENIDTSVLRRFFFHEDFNIILSIEQFSDYIDELKRISKYLEPITDIDKEKLYEIYKQKKFTLGEFKKIFAYVYMDSMVNKEFNAIYFDDLMTEKSFYELLIKQKGGEENL